MTKAVARETLLTKLANREHVRHRVIELLSRGATPPIVAKAMQIPIRKVYRIAEATQKVNARKVKYADVFITVGKAIARYEQIAGEAYQNYAQAEAPAMQARWLKLALEAADSANKLMQSMGMIPTATQEINLTSKIEVEFYGDAETSAAELMAELRGVGNLTN